MSCRVRVCSAPACEVVLPIPPLFRIPFLLYGGRRHEDALAVPVDVPPPLTDDVDHLLEAHLAMGAPVLSLLGHRSGIGLEHPGDLVPELLLGFGEATSAGAWVLDQLPPAQAEKYVVR